MISQFKHRIILLLILVAILAYAFFSEKILHQDGLGYDGVYYGNFTMHFMENIRDHAINKYYFQRLFLPCVIYNIFSLLHINLSIPNVILAYSIANLIFIFIGVCFFFRISNFIKLSKSIEVIGFAALFFCFPVLKFCLYYPILMDIPAFVMAIILVDLYFRRKIYLFFLVILLSSFIYPTFILLSVLYIFNSKKKNEIIELKQSRFISFLNNTLHIVVCYALPVYLIYYYRALVWQNSYELLKENLKMKLGETIYIWVCFFIALLYLIWLSYFSRKIFNVQKIFRSVNYVALILAVTVVILIQLIVNHWASKEEVPLTYIGYLYAIVHQMITNPLNFLVAHVFYFGLAPILSVFILKDIRQEIVNFGFGMILFFNMVMFFSVGSESRQLINYYPFLLFLLIYTLNKYWEVSMKFSIILSFISIVLSHFWYTINKGISPYAETTHQACLAFPLQHYFMFQGPWVNDTLYKIHLDVVFFLIVLFWFLIKKSGLVKRKSEALYP